MSFYSNLNVRGGPRSHTEAAASPFLGIWFLKKSRARRGFVLKGPSGAGLNKGRADGFFERAHTHGCGNGFVLEASGGQYDVGCKLKYSTEPVPRKSLNLDSDCSESPAGSSHRPHKWNSMSVDSNEDIRRGGKKQKYTWCMGTDAHTHRGAWISHWDLRDWS